MLPVIKKRLQMNSTKCACCLEEISVAVFNRRLECEMALETWFVGVVIIVVHVVRRLIILYIAVPTHCTYNRFSSYIHFVFTQVLRTEVQMKWKLWFISIVSHLMPAMKPSYMCSNGFQVPSHILVSKWQMYLVIFFCECTWLEGLQDLAGWEIIYLCFRVELRTFCCLNLFWLHCGSTNL